MTSCLMSSRNMELPAVDGVDRPDRPELDCGLEWKRGVGGWSSMSFPPMLKEDSGLSDNEEGCRLRIGLEVGASS